jgi:hypothetical protein
VVDQQEILDDDVDEAAETGAWNAVWRKNNPIESTDTHRPQDVRLIADGKADEEWEVLDRVAVLAVRA